MPTDTHYADCLESYINTRSEISVLYTVSDAVHLIMIMGDFNCQRGSRFYDIFCSLAADNNLRLSDINRLTEAFTYCSDVSAHMSWIDHCLCSRVIDMFNF